MNSRERVERAIRFEAPDRLPFNFWMDRARMAELEAQYGPDFRLTRYGVDVIESLPVVPIPTGELVDRYGSVWLEKPLFEDFAEAAALPLPDGRETQWMVPLDRDLATWPDRAVLAQLPSVLTYTEFMVPQEHLYLALRTQPDDVMALWHRLSDLFAQLAEQIVKRDITALYCADDIGFNGGLLLSLDDLRTYVVPHWRKVIDIAHAAGKPVFFHTDGKIVEAWELFSRELGVRMLNPMQPNLQDVGEFKRQYAGRTGIYGGLPTERIHMMTAEEMRATVVDLFERAGAGGGLIASTHDIDYQVGVEQLDALAAAVRDCTY